MTAISVTWTAKDASRLDPGKPITTGLKNNEWDNLTFLAEWLGASYLAGAVQNHDHDGINSAPIEVLPNLVKNGSFERDGGGGIPAGWTFTAYTGGSAAIVTSTQAHGRACVGITSTVLANGGGYYESANFFDVGGGGNYLISLWCLASVGGVSAKAEVIWYDHNEAQLSIGTIWSSAAVTDVKFTEQLARVVAPSSARLAKLRLTGGVPATGTSVGTIYFDGIMVPDFPPINATTIQPGGVGQSNITAGAVGQSQLKTADGTVSTINTTPINLILPGGGFGFYPQLNEESVSGVMDATIAAALSNSAYETNIALTAQSGATVSARQYYVQASPPYDLGDGAIGQFVFAVLDASGMIESVYSAPEAPWHNNGPTDIRADYYDADGRGWRWQDVRETEWLWDEVTQDHVPHSHVVGREQVEITQTIKQADMPLIPHPFLRNGLDGKTVVLLDPVADITWQLAEMHAQGVSSNELLHDDYLRVDNTALRRAGPPGVMVVPFRWRLTK